MYLLRKDKSLCLLDSSDKRHLGRGLSEALVDQKLLQRLKIMLQTVDGKYIALWAKHIKIHLMSMNLCWFQVWSKKGHHTVPTVVVKCQDQQKLDHSAKKARC